MSEKELEVMHKFVLFMLLTATVNVYIAITTLSLDCGMYILYRNMYS